MTVKAEIRKLIQRGHTEGDKDCPRGSLIEFLACERCGAFVDKYRLLNALTVHETNHCVYCHSSIVRDFFIFFPEREEPYLSWATTEDDLIAREKER